MNLNLGRRKRLLEHKKTDLLYHLAITIDQNNSRSLACDVAEL
mgnify:FL=1|jgi:hypothetical protein